MLKMIRSFSWESCISPAVHSWIKPVSWLNNIFRTEVSVCMVQNYCHLMVYPEVYLLLSLVAACVLTHHEYGRGWMWVWGRELTWTNTEISEILLRCILRRISCCLVVACVLTHHEYWGGWVWDARHACLKTPGKRSWRQLCYRCILLLRFCHFVMFSSCGLQTRMSRAYCEGPLRIPGTTCGVCCGGHQTVVVISFCSGSMVG